MRNLFFLIIIPVLWSCNISKNESFITIAAAANVRYPIEEIINEFERNNQTKVKFIIASSGKLTSQIVEGAPFDVFISADTRYPEALLQMNLTIGKPEIYARGILVLWSLNKDLNLSGKLDVLNDNIIKKIAIPNPDFAPYGLAAEEALKKSNIYDQVKRKLVYGQNISQTSQYIITQAADVGFTAKSVVLSETMKEYSNWIEIDHNLYSSIRQAAVLINREKLNPEAKMFYEFLFSEECQKIFQKYGYMLP
ncbi:molybdate ABC transporter substrate-binding protein [Bacteroidota bacterium]